MLQQKLIRRRCPAFPVPSGSIGRWEVSYYVRISDMSEGIIKRPFQRRLQHTRVQYIGESQNLEASAALVPVHDPVEPPTGPIPVSPSSFGLYKSS